MRNTAVGVQNPTNDSNPESNGPLTKIWTPVPRIWIPLACVVSVSVWFRGKQEERPKRNEIFALAARKIERDPFFAWSLSPVPRSLLPKLYRNACYEGWDSLPESRID